ncbi:SDR family oxidoreductase [Fictibacillus enclensis]|jgi:3-oxoacyl-[acyl-carrier protein] reductase|uniref:3-ketoacyl-ACP reductase n=1 Tax=Fictibacillus enclensis TaxID=1017270 RepID=A0A0V8JDW8_9BACL|nr:MULTISPECIES: SDR family oxidoreductase [Fictibacillus]KSU85130.1 3-ketoacyl-ACP reductase [Fictibacillus enclensis]MDM5198932.1 SDR family oxidoreductase [Fictibacillus enclensis]MDM5338134.1 SDR family oxidoreductase [Fictibacillus enclensis]RXY99212.1 KR domain-containing protein [Fictibacillus sp. S7]SCB91437.1 3-oxoacyl-[acyl-carrier protein] reductase [Fictibacillus enclensis]
MSKWVLVTGASGGIGSSISRVLAGAGYSLILHYNQGAEQAKLLEKELVDRYQIEILLLQADLSLKEGTEKLLSSLFVPVDAVIHNSASSYYGLLTDMKQETMERMIQLNLTSPIMITKHVLPQMVKRGRGNIIAVSSVWGAAGASCEVLYSTLKGGLNTFVKAMAKEAAPSGIRVNGIAPGAVETKMMSGFSEEELQDLNDEIPAGRLGKPEEIAEIALFLLSDKSSYINGHVITASGGWHS